ncbi:trans-sialidase, putative, partial [Trypanosoma cruzi marinkellei]
MSRRVFTSAVLLLFVVMCCGIGVAATEKNNVRTTLFTKGDLLNDTENANLSQAFDSFRAPSLVEAKGVVVAIVEAHYKNTTDVHYVGLAAKSMKSDGGAWTNGTAIVFDHYDANISRLLSPTSIVDGGDIRVLVGGYGTSGAPLTDLADGYWKPRMAGGWISNGSDGQLEFKWSPVLSTSGITYDFWGYGSTDPKSFKQFLGGGGAGIQLDDGSYVLPTQALNKDKKRFSLVILARKTTYGWRTSNDMSDDDCIQPAVLEWKDKSLLMMTSCGDGSRRVYWSSGMGTWWTEEYDTLSRVWGNSRTRKGHGVQGGFVSATIGGQKVILVSQPVYSGEAGKEAGRLHLWLTDLQRIYDFGPISAGNENVAASTLLYAADKTPSSKEPKDVKGKL